MLIKRVLFKQKVACFFHIFSLSELLVVVDERRELLPAQQVVIILDVVTWPLKLQD